MRFAIVMTYFERYEQLKNTLKSITQYKDTRVTIVDDCSPSGIPISHLLLANRIYGRIISPQKKTWTSNCIPFNMGFEAALEDNPDIVIIQNAECYHAGDIVGYAEKHLTDDNYISFGCYSLPKDSPIPPPVLWPVGASFDGEGAWYNHPIHRAVGYHFCSAITAKNLRKLNGFDERFAYGLAYEDNMFLHQVRNLGLKIEITAEPYVFHQWHYENKHNDPFLIKKNADLFSDLKQSNDYRAIHIITPDL